MNKFLKMMSQNDSKTLQARASQINTTGEIAYKQIIQTLENKKAKTELKIQDLTDFAPETTDSLRPGTRGWNPEKWANDLHAAKTELYSIQLELSIAKATYEEFFGNGEDKTEAEAE